jgi:hypothetical protein
MVKTFKVGDHVSWNSEAGRVRGKSSKSIDGMLITKATFTVLPRTSRSTKRRSGLRGAPVDVGESQKCRIATCRFTASGFPPPSSLLYFPADTPAGRGTNGIPGSCSYGFRTILTILLTKGAKALHEGANERIRLEPSQQIAKSASPSTCAHVSRSGRRTGVRGWHPTYFRAFSPWAA